MKKNWVKEFLIRDDGFYGHLYLPKSDDHPGKALLILGGGGMPYKLTQVEAEAFAGIGITALAIGYFGVPDAPKTIVRVPVEYVEKSAMYLHENGYEKVIAVGISKGAELALTAATLVPDINGVIAFAPSSKVYMGIGSGISWVNASSWTFRGAELPYAYAPASGWKALADSLKARELTFHPVYERADCAANEDSVIPVEHINGAVLVCGSPVDSLWPGDKACGDIIKRLTEKNFAYPYKQLIYPYASHLLLPFETGYEKLFRVGRKYPRECRDTIYRLQNEVLDWLKNENPGSI